MDLTYFQLLSNEPFSIGIGHISPMKIKTIRQMGENRYKMYLFYAVMTISKFYQYYIPDKCEEYENCSDEERKEITLFSLVAGFDDIILEYEKLFNVFFVENVKFSVKNKRFEIYTIEKQTDSKDNNKMKNIINIHGIINDDNFTDVLKIIAQLCNAEPVKSAQDDIAEIKDKSVRDMLIRIRNAKKKRQPKHEVKKEENPMFEMGNIISVVSSYGNNGINCINIEDITVANLYDQFARIVVDRAYNISARSVSVWGDKDKQFKSDSYLENLNKK